MAVEIEIKMKVPDLAPIRARLKQLGAQFKSSVLETNNFFDTPERKLLSQDNGLRIRHARDVNSGKEKTIITFKGPHQPGAVKSREERELAVDNIVDAIALLDALGFARMLTFQKRRETWQLNDCNVELDEMPHLGAFVEIEGPAEAMIQKCRRALDLTDQPHISASYASMLSDYLKQHGKSDRVVTF